MPSPLRIAPLISVAILCGCQPSRQEGTTHSLKDYNYCVISHSTSDGLEDEATESLNRAFIMLHTEDQRLRDQQVRAKACLLNVDTSHGFWHCSADIRLLDFNDRKLVIRDSVGGGFLYGGAKGDAKHVLEDLAAARLEAGPVVLDDGYDPSAAKATTASPNQAQKASVKERLDALEQLHKNGAVTDDEYAKKRQQILDDL